MNVLNKKQAAAKCGISVSQVDRMVIKGEFVEPIWMSERRKGFVEAELDAWIEEKQKARFAWIKR